jgi:hypothetical protein
MRTSTAEVLPRAVEALRRLAAITAASAVLGLLIGGVFNRLAMMLLAALNPAATGVESDDGFVIGRFTAAGTLNLLLAGTLIGVVGGGVYAAVRGLMIGPRWFRVASVSAGAAVVVGSMIVHADGVDFTALRPAALAVGLFVAIPGLFAAALTGLAGRWARPDGPFLRGRPLPALLPLALWLPLLPLFALLAAGWLVREYARGNARLRPALAHPSAAWAARAGLAAAFVVALLDLAGDVATL